MSGGQPPVSAGSEILCLFFEFGFRCLMFKALLTFTVDIQQAKMIHKIKNAERTDKFSVCTVVNNQIMKCRLYVWCYYG